MKRSTAKTPAGEFELPLRVTLVRPPAGVRLSLQGKDATELIGPATGTGGDVSFDFWVRVKPGGSAAIATRFLGPFTHGPPQDRFVYICSGTSAGQADSGWTRRAKVKLSIPPELIEKVRSGSAARLAARINGTAGDGGPACATVPLLDGGWKPVR